MSGAQACPKCGFAVSGAGFGMATCGRCGEIFLLADESIAPPPVENHEPIDEAAPGMDVDHLGEQFEVETPSDELVDLSDLADFGNAHQPSMGAGGLVFNLSIANVNTVEERKILLEVLSEGRLKLNASEIIQSLVQGKIEIADLNPVKASFIVGQLKRFSFEISWHAHQLVKEGILALFYASILFSLMPSRASADPWARHEVNLKGYQIQIRNGEEELRDLIAKKKQNTDPKIRDELLKEIIQKDEDLKKTFADMKREEEHIRFQHPEKGDETERKYRHTRLKSLAELEGEVGVDGQLSRLKEKVKDKYEE